MSGSELRKKFLDFFSAKGHIVVPSSSLVPDDPSVLLTTAGMQQFKPYYTGALDPMTAHHPTLQKPIGAHRATSVQKSFRTSDIEEVGDESHLTFFEMLGNFSFGKWAYFKKEAITYAHEFVTKTLGLTISYVTVFEGSAAVPKDEESKKIWNDLGISDVREDSIENVFWGPTGSEGPCGPTTEIYCKGANGHDIEVWNIVCNEYFYSGSREELLSGRTAQLLQKLPNVGVDTGMGLERLAMVVQKKNTVFETDLFASFLDLLPHDFEERKKCIMVDHLRASVFLLADGVHPSNKEAGYIVRRLLRRVFVYQYKATIEQHIINAVIHEIIHEYSNFYPELLVASENIQNEILREHNTFHTMLVRGLEILQKKETISGADAFDLYQSFGLPPEVTKELKPFDWKEFEEAKLAHTKVSSAGAEKKFGGHGLLLDTGELKAKDEKELQIVTRLHTATHLLQAALRAVLGEYVHQMGSDITHERMRFDFNFDRKVTPEELKKIENIVNGAISHAYEVRCEEMPYEEATQQGALHFFKEKYSSVVKVYTVGDFSVDSPEIFSQELCGGPHVKNTAEIKGIRIIKEEAVGAGVRRIRAVLT